MICAAPRCAALCRAVPFSKLRPHTPSNAQDVRIHDRYPTLNTFQLTTNREDGSETVGACVRNVTWRNVHAAAFSLYELPDVIHGNSSSSFITDLTFENVTVAGVGMATLLGDPAACDVNEFVYNLSAL